MRALRLLQFRILDVAAGKAFLDMLGVFAEFETNLRRERQLEGIAVAKVKGVYKGRPKSIDPGDTLVVTRVSARFAVAE